MLNRLKQIAWGALFGALIATQAIWPVWAQTAALLPNAVQQYFDASGTPVASGTVDYFVPSTTTRKTTWSSSTESVGTQNPNPVLLNAGGYPQNGSSQITGVYGDGCYRQIVKDQNGNTIWDQPTCSTGSGGGGGSGAFSEGVMVGAIIAWANPVLPGKYLYTAGQAISRTSFPDLLNALVFQQIILCSIGVSTITVSTNVSDKVPIGTPIEASCFAPGTTVTSKSSGLLTMSSPATATTSVASTLFPWGNGNGSTTFNVPDLRGRVLAGPDNMTGSVAGTLTSTYYGVNPDAINAIGGNESGTLMTANFPPYTPTGTVPIVDPGHLHLFGGAGTSETAAINNNSGGGGGSFSAMSSTQLTQTESAVTGITASFVGAAQGGSSTPVSKVQPTLTADYIIKALPDDLPSGPGVTSIQGMTGALFCGSGLLCTAQTLSVLGAGSIAVGSTTVVNGTSGSPTTIITNNAGVVGELAIATAAQFMAGSANKIVQAGTLWQDETTTTFGTTTTFDFSTFKNTAVTLTGNITTQTLTNVLAGKAGSITFIQDGAGSHTTVWNSIFKFSSGTTPTLTATAGAVDILSYSCRTTTFCQAAMMNDVK